MMPRSVAKQQEARIGALLSEMKNESAIVEAQDASIAVSSMITLKSSVLTCRMHKTKKRSCYVSLGRMTRRTHTLD